LGKIGFIFDDQDARHVSFLTQEGSQDARELDADRRAATFAIALSRGVAAVLASNGAHEIEPEAGTLGTEHGTAGHAIEAAKDALEVRSGYADALVGDADAHPGVAFD